MFFTKVVELALAEISCGRWAQSFGSEYICINEVDKKLLKFLIQENYISRDALMKAVHEGLCASGRYSYQWCMVNPNYNHPDHAYSPKAFGYAMMHRVFTKEELSKLQFDHGETIESYIHSAQGLLDWAVAEFTKPYVKPIPSKQSKPTNAENLSPCCA